MPYLLRSLVEGHGRVHELEAVLHLEHQLLPVRGHLLGTVPDHVHVVVVGLQHGFRLLLHLQRALVCLLRAEGEKGRLTARGARRPGTGAGTAPGVRPGFRRRDVSRCSFGRYWKRSRRYSQEKKVLYVYIVYTKKRKETGIKKKMFCLATTMFIFK